METIAALYYNLRLRVDLPWKFYAHNVHQLNPNSAVHMKLYIPRYGRSGIHMRGCLWWLFYSDQLITKI